MLIPFWIYDCTWCCRWGGHLWCMAHQHPQLCELCFNCLLKRLLCSCNCSDQFWHSTVDSVYNALEIMFVQYCMILWFWAFPFLSRRASRICCTWFFFTNCFFSLIYFFFPFLLRSLILFSFSFSLFFFSFAFPLFFIFLLFDLDFWLIFDNLYYIFMCHSIVTNVSITTLLWARLQVDVMSICREGYYLSIPVDHLVGDARTTNDSFIELVIIIIKHHLVGILPRNIWSKP